MDAPFWCRVDISGFVSDIRPFDGTQSQPTYQPLTQMPVTFGPWSYNSGNKSVTQFVPRVPRLPREVVADLVGITNAQALIVISDLNSPASGVGTPAKWQFSRNAVTWAAAPIFRNYSGIMQREAAIAAVAFYCIENPFYLTSGTVVSGVNIPGAV